MKKISLFMVMGAIAALTLGSCKDDCTVCTFADGRADTENCGSDNEQQAFEIAQELDAAFSGTTVSCDKK